MIKIAVTNYDAYVNNELIFEWLTVPFDENELKEVFNKIGTKRYFISDYECELFHIRIREYENLKELNELCKTILDLSDYELKELQAVSEIYSVSLNELIEIFEASDFTLYDVESMEELAEMFIFEGCFGEIPKAIENYIDYEKIARDLEIDGYTKTSHGIIMFY